MEDALELRKLSRRAVMKFGAETAVSLGAARRGLAAHQVVRIGFPFELSGKFEHAGSVDT